MSKKYEDYLKRIVIDYAYSILQLVDGIKGNNIHQVISLIKANIKVLENDARKSPGNTNQRDYTQREYN